MTTRFAATMLVTLLAGASEASAACGWFGTQLECRLGSSEVVIGTQTADDPVRGTTLRPSALFGGGRLPEDRSQSATRFRLEFQNFVDDPTRCRKIESAEDTYCY